MITGVSDIGVAYLNTKIAEVTQNIIVGTLVGGLGCFPFDNEPYRPLSDCRGTTHGIRSLAAVGRRVAPQSQSVSLPPYAILLDASPKAISGRTSYL